MREHIQFEFILRPDQASFRHPNRREERHRFIPVDIQGPAPKWMRTDMQSVYLELVPNKGWRMVDRVDGLVAIPWNVDDASTQGPPHGLWITQDRGQALLWELRPLSVMA